MRKEPLFTKDLKPLPKKEKKKLPKLSTLANKADDLWSECVKEKAGWKCEYCGKTEPLNSHHVFSRNNKSVRWELSNGICLCVAHHTFSTTFSAHGTGPEFTYWLEAYRGKDYMERLQRLAHIPTKVTRDILNDYIETFKIIMNT